MKIAILTHNLNPYSQKRLIDVGTDRKHIMNFIPISHCFMNISSLEPSVHYREEKFQYLEAIIPQINPMHTFYGTAILRQFEGMGIYALNPSLSISRARDKIWTLQHLARKNIPLPITSIADSPQESEKLIDIVGGAPLIVRLLEGSQGRGTVFAETTQAALSVINAFKQLKTHILVQEYVQEANSKDLRCFVLGNEVIASIQRDFLYKSSQGSQHSPKLTLSKLTPEEMDIAISACAAMNLNFASVDLIRSKRGPLLLDIDPAPNIAVFEKVTEQDITTKIFTFIEKTVLKGDEFSTIARQ